MSNAQLSRPADVLLADGRIASVRPLAGGDRADLLALHDAALLTSGGVDVVLAVLVPGPPRVDAHAVEHLIVAIGELALDVPQLIELDLNPVMCIPAGAVPVDAKIRLPDPLPLGDDLPRQLRTSS